MRAAWIAIVLAGCGEPKLVMKPLPPLVEPQPRSQAHEIVVTELGLSPGAHWIWDVQVHGFSIGHAELRVGDDHIESQFHTGGLASAFASIGHDLVTLVDRVNGRPLSSTERVDVAGKLRQFTTQLAGTTAHSFHTALGVIRAWARPDAQAGFINVVQADQLFRLELQPPIVQQEQLRIDGHVIGPDADFHLTIWLDAAHVPVRIEIRDGDEQVTAELIAS